MSTPAPSRRRDSAQPSRRAFLRRAACAAVGTSALASTVLDLRMISAASAAYNLSDYKAMVCLFLYGGNDGNNTLVPTDSATYGAYSAARGGLAIPQAQLLGLNPTVSDGHSYGLHPSCPELQGLFNTGKLAILANVGTLVAPITRAQYFGGSSAVPQQLFSHNDQAVQWMTSVADVPTRTGWGGRTADLLSSVNSGAQVSMSITLSGANTFEVGNAVNQYAITPSGAIGLSQVSGAQLQAMKDLLAVPHSGLFEQEYTNLTTRAMNSSALVTGALGSVPALKTSFPGTDLGNQLKMIAQLVGARNALSHKRQIFFASVNGYDLHGGQYAPHAALLQELSQCMKAFYDATVELGVSNNVTTFTASDFGRTLPGNGGGSDHGWGNHQLIMGGAVKGQRVYGTFPTLAINGPDDSGLGRWIPTTAVDEYSATLAKWFGVSSADMTSVFPNLGRFAHPDLGFMG